MTEQLVHKPQIHNPKALVSVIIPMYKVEALLSNCIAQLKAQTYKHLELLFVDDASPDRAYNIVQEAIPSLEAEGFYVRLLKHESNRGVAAARNTALNVATGEYIYSFDADDAMDARLIERLALRAYQTQVDIVGCNWALRYKGVDRKMSQPQVKTGKEMYEAMCYGVMKWNLWLFLFRRELLERGEQLRFVAGDNMGEDMMMMCKLALRADRVSIVPEHLYYYVKTNQTAQTANYQEDHWQQVDRNLQNLSDYLKKYYLTQDNTSVIELLKHLKLSLKLPLLISLDRADYKRWAGWYSEAHKVIMLNPHQSLRTKLLQKVASRGWWHLVRAYNIVVTKYLYPLLYA